MNNAHHKNGSAALVDLCRVCGCKLHRGIKAKGRAVKPEPPYSCISYADKFLVAFNVYCPECPPGGRVAESQAGVRPVTGRPDSPGLSGQVGITNCFSQTHLCCARIHFRYSSFISCDLWIHNPDAPPPPPSKKKKKVPCLNERIDVIMNAAA